MVKVYSKILKENFLIQNDGTILFESGVIYNRQEINKLKQESLETKKKIHLIKQLFEVDDDN